MGTLAQIFHIVLRLYTPRRERNRDFAFLTFPGAGVIPTNIANDLIKRPRRPASAEIVWPASRATRENLIAQSKSKFRRSEKLIGIEIQTNHSVKNIDVTTMTHKVAGHLQLGLPIGHTVEDLLASFFCRLNLFPFPRGSTGFDFFD